MRITMMAMIETDSREENSDIDDDYDYHRKDVKSS